jgi:glycosyltransferase involved in cell wall biosynthesis
MTAVSVIATVLNEGEAIRRLLDSLAAQTHPPDEVVITDGGSRDATLAILNAYRDRLPLRLIEAPGCNISAGRNRAIAAARGPLIAVTDAGVRLPDTWLAHLIRPLLDQPDLQVVGGFFRADPHTVFEAALGATVLPALEDIHPQTFLPSSRSVAFRKTAWEQVGGYPEWLDYCEDLIFDLRLRQMTGPLAFAPDAVVDFRPRGSLRAFWTQYYRYARGDGKADLWRRRHAIRYGTYLGGALLALAGLRLHPALWLLFLPGAAAYLRGPSRRLPGVLRRLERRAPLDGLRAALLLPVIRIVGDAAKMAGYPVGWWWRLRHHPPDWRQG